MLCQCWSYFFHRFNIDKMSIVLVLYQCHFKTCCYNVTLTSYQWLYQHWTLNILLRCYKSTHTKRGQVCDVARWGGICCKSHPWMGWSLRVCECNIQGGVELKWTSLEVQWENILCVGQQPLAISLDALYFQSSLTWPLLAHYSEFHHAGYERRPHSPPHYNDRHEQIKFKLKNVNVKAFFILLLCVHCFVHSSWNYTWIFFQPSRFV
jgi:hypothetical protein